MILRGLERRIDRLKNMQTSVDRPRVVVYLPDNGRGPVSGPQEHILPNGPRVVIYHASICRIRHRR